MAESNVPADFVLSQRGKRLLHFDKNLFNLNKRRKYGDSYKLLWQCERRHDTACAVYVTTDDNGVVIKQPTVTHNHAIPVGRAEALVVRSNILTEAERRPEAAPASIAKGEVFVLLYVFLFYVFLFVRLAISQQPIGHFWTLRPLYLSYR